MTRHSDRKFIGAPFEGVRFPRNAFFATIAVILLACLPSSSNAQPSGKSAVDLNSPGDEHRLLGAFVGTWDVTLTIPIGEGRHIEGKSLCKAEWVFDGRFVRQEYSSTFRGKPLTVVRYLGFDRHKRKVIEIQFESTHTDVLYSEGDLSEDGRTTTCWGTHIDVATNQPVRVRTVTTIVDTTAFTLQMIYTDNDGNDSKTVTLAHKRRE